MVTRVCDHRVSTNLAAVLWVHRVAGTGRNGTECDGANTLFVSLYHVPCLVCSMVTQGGRGDGTEQEGTGPTQTAEATGSTRAATATQEGPIRMLPLFVIASLLSYFLHLALLLFRLFLSRQVQQQAGHKREARDGRDAADGANGYVFFYVFFLLTLLFYSYHSSSFPIISFSVEYNNRQPGGGRQTRAVHLFIELIGEQQ